MVVNAFLVLEHCLMPFWPRMQSSKRVAGAGPLHAEADRCERRGQEVLRALAGKQARRQQKRRTCASAKYNTDQSEKVSPHPDIALRKNTTYSEYVRNTAVVQIVSATYPQSAHSTSYSFRR